MREGGLGSHDSSAADRKITLKKAKSHRVALGESQLSIQSLNSKRQLPEADVRSAFQ